MVRKCRLLIIFLIITLALPLGHYPGGGPGWFMPFLPSQVLAADALNLKIATAVVNNKVVSQFGVDEQDTGWAKLTWNAYPGAAFYVVSYRDHTGANQIINNGNNTNINLENLRKDFIYQFDVSVYNGLDVSIFSTTQPLCVLIGSTLEVTRIVQDPPANSEIVESGKNPRLEFKITIPNYFDGGIAPYISNGATHKLDFRIFPDENATGTTMSPINVRYSTESSSYIATGIWNGQVKTIAATVDNDGDYLTFQVEGVPGLNPAASELTALDLEGMPTPTPTPAYPASGNPGFAPGNMQDFGMDPDDSTTNLQEVYRNPDIIPGTLYKMKIEPIFYDGKLQIGLDQYPCKVGTFYVTGGSVFTFLRFRVYRFGADDGFIEVFKAHRAGQLEEVLGFTYNAYFTLENNPDENSDLEYLNGYRDENPASEESVFIYFVNESQSVWPNYCVNATLSVSGEDIEIRSYFLQYIPTTNPALPPLSENVTVKDANGNQNLIFAEGNVYNDFYEDPATPAQLPSDANIWTSSADVVIRWSIPENYDSLLLANGTTPLDYHIWLASDQDVPLLDDPDKLTDPELIEEKEQVSNLFGVAGKNKEYSLFYREVAVVNLEDCDVVTVNGKRFLQYTLSGLELFDGLVNHDAYPTYLLPNKVYYLKIISTKSANQSGESVPVSFTIPLSASRNLPLPQKWEIFSVSTPAPTPTVAPTATPTPTSTPSPTPTAGPTPTASPTPTATPTPTPSPTPTVYPTPTPTPTPTPIPFTPVIELTFSSIPFNRSDYVQNPAAVVSEVYYDLYISDVDDPQRYILLDSTQGANLNDNGAAGEVDVDFIRNTTQVAGEYIYNARIKNFTLASAVQRLGNSLRTNSTYYFRLKTRVMVDGLPMTSDLSAALTVSIPKEKIKDPPANEIIPRVPSDFSIALDDKQIKRVSSTSSVLNWTGIEEDPDNRTIRYTMIRTSMRIDPAVKNLDSIAYTAANRLHIYFSRAAKGNAGLSVQESETDGIASHEFTYTATGMEPNSIYYLSLRAEKQLPDGTWLESVWVTIPVTTTLIVPPSSLSVVPGVDIGVNFDLSSIYQRDDFTVFLAEPGQWYVQAKGGTYAITEDSTLFGGNWSRFYLHLTGLKANTPYYIRILGRTAGGSGEQLTNEVLIYYDAELNNSTYTYRTHTLEPTHEIDLKWIGDAGFKYELAIKSEDEGNYTIISEKTSTTAGFVYMSVEKIPSLMNTNNMLYYARISGLKSNTRYSVKVRSIDHKDTYINATLIHDDSYSRYIGPVEFRTEFSQADFDLEDDRENEAANYYDQINRFKETLFWVMKDSATYSIKLRGDMAGNAVQNLNAPEFVLDLSPLPDIGTERANVYIPYEVIQLLEQYDKNLLLKTRGFQISLRPGFLSNETLQIIERLSTSPGVKGVYIQIDLQKLYAYQEKYPEGAVPASGLWGVAVKAAGFSLSDAELEQQIKNKLNELVHLGLSELYLTGTAQKDTSAKLADVLDQIMDRLEVRLKSYVWETINGSAQIGSIVRTSQLTGKTGLPVLVKLDAQQDTGYLYQAYLKQNTVWTPFASNPSLFDGSVEFETLYFGKMVILKINPVTAFGLKPGHWSTEEITAFLTKYDLSSIFGDNNKFDADLPVKTREMVILIEQALGSVTLSPSSSPTSIAKRAQALGFSDIISFTATERILSRQEVAALVIRIYEIKTGAVKEQMRPGKLEVIDDEADIKTNYYKAVELCIDFGIMTLEDGDFRPLERATRGEAVVVITRLLKLLGEL